jgi:two-component system response regulator RegA
VSTNASVLIVDDDPAFGPVLARALGRRGFAARWARSSAQAMEAAAESPPRYVVLDLNLDGDSGLNLVVPLLARSPTAQIVVLTGYASIATAVEAVKLGAAEYLAKPASMESLVRALRPAGDAPLPAPVGGYLSVPRLEWEYIQRVLAEHDGNVAATARALGMHRRTLQRKLGKRPPGQ